ncbi:MAG: hypothetical protein V3U68_03785 [Bacteroidota bacterium]
MGNIIPKREGMGRTSRNVIIAWACLPALALAQVQSVAPPLNYESSDRLSFSLLRFVGNLVLPRLVKDEVQLKRYIRDRRFMEIRRYYGDLVAVDAIYQKAVQLVDYDIHDALLITFFATIDHRRVGVRIPLLGALFLPLTAESDSLFQGRWANLPSRLYGSGDGGKGRDRDKLQHFFGSAFLTYALRSSESASLAGSFVEWGEDAFIVGGQSDWRDRQANEQGRLFGRSLGDDPTVLPSDFLSRRDGLARAVVMEQPVLEKSSHEIDPCCRR